MTVMEQKPNANLVHETNKFQMINVNHENSQQGCNVYQFSNQIKNEEKVNYSRKNSATGSNGIPASNLSLSSTSSGGSSKYDSKFKKFSNNSFKQYDSTPQTSRRASGNSITIKITSENNDNIEDESLNKVLNEIDSFDKQDIDDLVNDRGYGDRDRDDAEDTTSNSTSNEHLAGIAKQNSKKKLKDRRRLQRSSVQQQHHLNYQESEDQIEEELKSKYNSLEQLNETVEYQAQSMNSAFDELFAAAETGNSSISAIVEAKMAAATSAASHALINDSIDYDLRHSNETESSFKKNSARSRNSSFRVNNNNNYLNSNKKVQSIDESRFVNNNYNSTNESTNTLNKSISNKKNSNNALNVETNLGAPQQLTRSCSCKRPGSFKKMKAKNGVSPSRNQISNGTPAQKITNSGPLINNSSSNHSSAINNGTSRRGTQCSITISETLDNQANSRAGSLPFEQLNNMIQQQTNPNSILLNANDEDAEVYRVRQFNITNKGSVINRGDSFKRSFKRSNNSISSKKEASTVHYEGNTLNLPDYQEGFLNKSSNSSNYGLNESNNDCASNNAGVENINLQINENNTNNMTLVSKTNEAKGDPVKNFLVYVIGSTGVGKNALIKQFKTSEYRGTYDIDQANEDDSNEGVNVMLDGVESILQFMSMDFDMMKPGVISLSEITKDNDAFIVVYSITDKASFLISIDLIKSIRISENNRPVILVGNKSDLVRKRSVNREDGRNIAMKFGCKFVETSVAINDKVDDLLAGILKQIRLKDHDKQPEENEEMTTSFIENSSSLLAAPKKHTRNYSDANIDELIRKTSKTHLNNSHNLVNNTMSFRTNTLTRRLFRSKNKENIDNDNMKFKRNQSLGGSSFFHKIFNNIFRKKSNLSHLNSVENLYTPPVVAKSKKN